MLGSQGYRVSRRLLARAWAAGAGPGDAPLTIDLDSTICETSPLTLVAHPRQLVPCARPGHGHNFATDWPRRVPAATATPAPVAITRCWPLPPAPARC